MTARDALMYAMLALASAFFGICVLVVYSDPVELLFGVGWLAQSLLIAYEGLKLWRLRPRALPLMSRRSVRSMAVVLGVRTSWYHPTWDMRRRLVAALKAPPRSADPAGYLGKIRDL